MSLKLKCHKNRNVTKPEISPKMNLTKTKCYQNKNIIKTEILPKLKCPPNFMLLKLIFVLKIKI